MKYNELQQTHSDQAAADSDDNNGVFSLLTANSQMILTASEAFCTFLCDVFQMGSSDEGFPALRILVRLMSSDNGELMADLLFNICENSAEDVFRKSSRKKCCGVARQQRSITFSSIINRK